MILSEVIKILDAELIWNYSDLNKEIKIAYGSDLLSEVLTFAKSEALLLTNLINIQVIRTAEMVDIIAVCFVNEKKPELSTIELAKNKNIPLISTKFSMCEACEKLKQDRLPCCSEVLEV